MTAEQGGCKGGRGPSRWKACALIRREMLAAARMGTTEARSQSPSRPELPPLLLQPPTQMPAGAKLMN